MENKDIKYIPYVLSDYTPLVGNYKISSKYAIQIPSEKWKMYPLKMFNIDLL